ncbi:MAG TPA: hypothetical protein VFG34_01920 [Sphingopyxis sp.]|nr:hypothetical protein [Sphingopyxis sp.]
MARPNPEEPTLFERTIEEAKAIGRQGLAHPSAKPVLIGCAIGAMAGALLPLLNWPLGLLAGGVIALIFQAKP